MSLNYADAHHDLVEQLDERLRAAVRRDGIAPSVTAAECTGWRGT